jgi:UDP-N-acetylglucosamine acyltransferase
MAYSHIAHDCTIGDYCIFSNNSTLAGHVTVGKKVILSGFTAVHQFCTLGEYAFVAGGSLVRKDVPPYIKVGREPLTYAGVNSVGLSRNNFSDEQIKQIQTVYRTVFQSNLNTNQALAVLENEVEESEEKSMIVEFLKKSERGIVKGYS